MTLGLAENDSIQTYLTLYTLYSRTPPYPLKNFYACKNPDHRNALDLHRTSSHTTLRGPVWQPGRKRSPIHRTGRLLRFRQGPTLAMHRITNLVYSTAHSRTLCRHRSWSRPRSIFRPSMVQPRSSRSRPVIVPRSIMQHLHRLPLRRRILGQTNRTSTMDRILDSTEHS